MTSTVEILASDEDEKIRVYGSTTAEKQFRSKTKRKNTDESPSPIISSTDIQVDMHTISHDNDVKKVTFIIIFVDRIQLSK